jgi:hypothetical protein
VTHSKVPARIFSLTTQFYVPPSASVHNRYTWLKPRSAMLSHGGISQHTNVQHTIISKVPLLMDTKNNFKYRIYSEIYWFYKLDWFQFLSLPSIRHAVLIIRCQNMFNLNTTVNLLKPPGYVMYCTNIFNIQQLYVLPTMYWCFIFISEQTATSAPYSLNWLASITEMRNVYCAVRTGSLNKAVCASSFKR